MTKISVIIPVYNTAQYLERCLDSLLRQTLSDIEIICIDDGSKDNSLEVLEKIKKSFGFGSKIWYGYTSVFFAHAKNKKHRWLFVKGQAERDAVGQPLTNNSGLILYRKGTACCFLCPPARRPPMKWG